MSSTLAYTPALKHAFTKTRGLKTRKYIKTKQITGFKADV